MRLNWMAHTYSNFDGYGRFSGRMVAALNRSGVDAQPLLCGHESMPGWLRARAGVDFAAPTLACMPPYCLRRLPVGAGPLWLYSMTEGSELPEGWAEAMHKARVERVFVPCEYNRVAFATAGLPVTVIPGGTDPDEFALMQPRPVARPYVFGTLADRGARKGWVEVWSAFFRAFGPPEETPDVRLVIKSRPDVNETVGLIAGARDLDPRIRIYQEDVEDARDIYAAFDCLALPSRSEGWGMPHREAAMMGKPVITLRYGGLDDGHTHEWSLPVETMTLRPIPKAHEHIAGEWARADVDELAGLMRQCYDNPDAANRRAQEAAAWLRANQTWGRTAAALLAAVGVREAV